MWKTDRTSVSSKHAGSLPSQGTSLAAQMIKNPPAMKESPVRSLVGKDPMEEDVAAHSSIPAQRIPWIEEPGGL